jgi:hypothetical protein
MFCFNKLFSFQKIKLLDFELFNFSNVFSSLLMFYSDQFLIRKMHIFTFLLKHTLVNLAPG